MLLIFGGLPTSGKSTVSQSVARKLGAAYIRVDTIEQTLRDVGFSKVHSEGYELAYKLAADNLVLGLTVVADSANSTQTTRDAWRAVGEAAGVPALEIEIICSDKAEHRRRVESRVVDIENLTQPTWNDVIARDYELWPQAIAAIDTAGDSPEKSVKKTLSLIELNSTI